MRISARSVLFDIVAGIPSSPVANLFDTVPNIFCTSYAPLSSSSFVVLRVVFKLRSFKSLCDRLLNH